MGTDASTITAGEAIAAELTPEALPSQEQKLRELEAQRHRAHARRTLHLTPDEDGSLLIDGSLPTLEGEKFRRLIAAYVASDRSAHRNASQQSADRRSSGQRNADALVALLDKHGSSTHLPELAGDRPRIVVTMTEESLRERADQAGPGSANPSPPGRRMWRPSTCTAGPPRPSCSPPSRSATRGLIPFPRSWPMSGLTRCAPST